MYLFPKVPEKCFICDSIYIGGCALPGERFPKPGLRVFYDCGASLSIKQSEFNHNVYHLLFKNCWCDENLKEIMGQ